MSAPLPTGAGGAQEDDDVQGAGGAGGVQDPFASKGLQRTPAKAEEKVVPAQGPAFQALDPRPISGSAAATGAVPRTSGFVPRPGAFRPVSTGPTLVQIPPDMDAQEFLANYELGREEELALGARYRSADAASPVNRNLNVSGFVTPGRLQALAFSPANYNSPSLNLVGGYDLTRVLREERRRQDTSRRVIDNTRLAEALMEQQRLDQTADEENRILRENLEQVANILEPVLGQQAAAANAATAAAPAANVGGVNPQKAGREAINVNLEGVQAALNIQQERVNRAEEARRNPAASGRSSTLEESLLGPFMNIQRVLGRLNNPATRDDPGVQARNVASVGLRPICGSPQHSMYV